jgi:hypothetical protein
MPFPLQDTEGDQAAGEMMQLRPLRAGLTAAQPELILTHSNDFLDLRAYPIEATDLRSRQRQAIGGKVFGAVSDDQDFLSTSQPSSLCPIRVAPIRPEWLAVEAAILLEAAHKIPPIVANPLQQTSGRIPGVEEDLGGATAQAIAGITEQLQRQLILRGPPFAP